MEYKTGLLLQHLCGDSSFKKRVYILSLSIPTLDIHYKYLKFMKSLVLGDVGIVRMEFFHKYHLLQIRKRAVRVVTNLHVQAMRISGHV